MSKLIRFLIVIICSSYLAGLNGEPVYILLPTAVVIGSPLLFFRKRKYRLLYIIIIVATLFLPYLEGIRFFAPFYAFAVNQEAENSKWWDGLVFVLIGVIFMSAEIVFLSASSIYLSRLILDTKSRAESYLSNLDEMRFNLRKLNEEAIKKGLEFNNLSEALVLNEREKISTKMHNVLGLGLGSSVLQVEALKIQLNSGADTDIILNGLESLSANLSNGLRETRNAIHNVFDESFDLNLKITKLVSETPTEIIKINYSGNFKTSTLNFDRALFGVIKEAVNNSIKHAKSDEFNIRLIENDSYRLIRLSSSSGNLGPNINIVEGVGFASFRGFAEEFGGEFSYYYKNGLKLNFSFPIRGKHENNVGR